MPQFRFHSSILRSLRFALFVAWAPGLAAEVNPTVMPALADEANWCWAASDQMVMARYGDELPQCDIVTTALSGTPGQPDCCSNSLPSACNTTGFPSIENFGYSAPAEKSGPLTWDEIMAEINANRPFIFTWNFSDGGGSHLLVGVGWRFVRWKGSKIKEVGINDPTPDTGGFSWVTEGYYNASSEHSIGTNYYHIDR